MWLPSIVGQLEVMTLPHVHVGQICRHTVGQAFEPGILNVGTQQPDLGEGWLADGLIYEWPAGGSIGCCHKRTSSLHV